MKPGIPLHVVGTQRIPNRSIQFVFNQNQFLIIPDLNSFRFYVIACSLFSLKGLLSVICSLLASISSKSASVR